jgi:hypothetical protein
MEYGKIDVMQNLNTTVGRGKTLADILHFQDSCRIVQLTRTSSPGFNPSMIS